WNRREHQQRPLLLRMLTHNVHQVLHSIYFPSVGPIESADAVRNSHSPEWIGRETRSFPWSWKLFQILRQCVVKLFGQVFRIRIVLPLKQVHRWSVGPEVVRVPDKVNNGVRHLLVGETEAKAAIRINPRRRSSNQIL